MLEQANYNEKKAREIDPALYSRYRNGIKDICNDKQHDNEVLDWLNLEEDEDGNIKDKEYKPTEVYWFYGSQLELVNH